MTSNMLNKLRKVRQSDATWLCTVRRAPCWIMPKKQPPYRPFVVLVIDQNTELILQTNTSDERPTPEAVLDILFKTMQGTLLTLWRRKRPTRILIDDAELVRAIAPRLAELDIHCGQRASLPQINAALLEMENNMTRHKPIPGLLSISGATVPLVAELFAAAADYYRQKPWRWLENWMAIEVHYPPEGRARFALVLGGGGEYFGLSLYESLADLDVLFERSTSEQSYRRPLTWLSLVLEEATAMSFADLDASEKYAWPVAGEKAYPVVFKPTSGDDNLGGLPAASELYRLAAALRVIPGFVSQHLRTTSSLPRPVQATYDLPGVHAGQQIMLRFPAGTKPTAEDRLYSPDTPQSVDPHELEEYIQEWYWDEASHEFARQLGTFLFQFLDHLDATGLTRKTMRKHESNCWCIGSFECSHGYDFQDTFTPTIFLGGPVFISEFERKVSDSSYAVKSYKATWRKLEKYVSSLGYDNP